MARGPGEWNTGKTYQKILWKWTARASDILTKVARPLASDGLDVQTLRSEEWDGSITWQFEIHGRVGKPLKEEGWVYVTIAFHPTEDAPKIHVASLSLMEGGGGSIKEFLLTKAPIDVTNETQMERAFEKANELVPKVIEVLLSHDWEPSED